MEEIRNFSLDPSLDNFNKIPKPNRKQKLMSILYNSMKQKLWKCHGNNSEWVLENIEPVKISNKKTARYVYAIWGRFYASGDIKYLKKLDSIKHDIKIISNKIYIDTADRYSKDDKKNSACYEAFRDHFLEKYPEDNKIDRKEEIRKASKLFDEIKLSMFSKFE
jgi:hypothetical protein